MAHPISHFLSDRFPDIDHPAYQTVFEKLGFVAVTMALVGLLIGSIALVVITLA